jgi:hypothetical protein
MTREITRTLLWAQCKVNLKPYYLLHSAIAIAVVVLHRENARRTQSQSLGTSFCDYGIPTAAFRATRAQLAGIFFITSIFSKTLLSRAPCALTHFAIA